VARDPGAPGGINWFRLRSNAPNQGGVQWRARLGLTSRAATPGDVGRLGSWKPVPGWWRPLIKGPRVPWRAGQPWGRAYEARRRQTPSPGWPRLELGDYSRDPLVSDHERREAGRAVLGQMLSWALKLRGSRRLGGRDEGRPPDFEDLGLNRMWAEKGKEKEFPFYFQKEFS
jgi:hypothetical protein